MALRFTRPDVTTLTLPSGDTLTVRRRLTTGEARARLARMSELRDGELQFNQLLHARATVTAYLLDWNVVDAETGQRVDIRQKPIEELESILDNLDPDDFRAVREAIEAHMQAMDAEREAEKKTTPGARTSSPISSSLVGVGGGMSG